MTECICPDDGRQVNSTDRMYVMEPGAEVVEGNTVRRDMSKVHIFNKHCPVHGYRVLEEEEGESPSGD